MSTDKISKSLLNFQCLPNTNRKIYFQDYLPVHLCAICDDILLEPRQSSCGCRYCFQCMKQFKKCNSCVCGAQLTENLIIDKALEKEILNLSIRCPRCDKVLIFKDLYIHIENCEFKNYVECQFCHLYIAPKEYLNCHLNPLELPEKICAEWVDSCPFERENSEIVNIKEHVSECSNLINCVMSDFGCPISGTRDEINIHLKNDVSVHLEMVAKHLRGQKNNGEIEQLQCDNKRLKEELSTLKLKLNELETNLEDLKKQPNICQEQLETGAVSYDMPEADDYKNEVFIWKVSDIREKIAASLHEEIVNDALFSEPFYTNKPGYKLKLKLFPAGDRKNKSRFLSLYIMIMSGEFDNEVDWPFKYKINLILKSNRSDVPDKIRVLIPDNNNACFGRPQMRFNLATGIPKYIELNELIKTDKFVKSDGSIVIKAFITV